MLLLLILFAGEVVGSLWSNTDTSLTMIDRELEMERERNEKLNKSINHIEDKDIINSNHSSVQLGNESFFYHSNAQESNHMPNCQQH
jgi:hypothetical protein